MENQNQVQFEGGDYRRSYETSSSKLIEWVIAHSGGRIKDEAMAGRVLLGAVVVIICISIFIFTKSSAGSRPPVSDVIPTYEVTNQ